MKIYLIRHGETKWNRLKRLQGWKNSELTEAGRQSASKLKERLEEEKIEIDKIYSSNLKRAVETAEIIRGDKDINHVKLEDLREISYGIWEGMELEDILEDYGENYHNFKYESHKYNPQINGESFKDFFNRTRRALEEIISSQAEDVLVVSHGVTIKAIVAMIENIGLEEFHTIPIYQGTSLNIIEVDEDGSLSFIVKGDDKHIG